jgi:hypothetical protein
MILDEIKGFIEFFSNEEAYTDAALSELWSKYSSCYFYNLSNLEN